MKVSPTMSSYLHSQAFAKPSSHKPCKTMQNMVPRTLFPEHGSRNLVHPQNGTHFGKVFFVGRGIVTLCESEKTSRSQVWMLCADVIFSTNSICFKDVFFNTSSKNPSQKQLLLKETP